MKNLIIASLTAAAAFTNVSAFASDSTTKPSVIAVCQNKFFGGESTFIGHFDQRGVLRNIETQGLELVLPSLPIESTEDGVIFGARYSSRLSSGAVVTGALAGRNIYFTFAGNGGLVIDQAWGGVVPTAIEFNSNNEAIKSLNIKITYLSQRNVQIIEEQAIIEDCTFADVKLGKAANLLSSQHQR